MEKCITYYAYNLQYLTSSFPRTAARLYGLRQQSVEQLLLVLGRGCAPHIFNVLLTFCSTRRISIALQLNLLQ